jgi:hypothetical protein
MARSVMFRVRRPRHRDEGNRKIDYGSCTFHIWAESTSRLDHVRTKMLSIVGEQLVRHEMFTIDWQFSSRRGLSSASFDEIAIQPLTTKPTRLWRIPWQPSSRATSHRARLSERGGARAALYRLVDAEG